MNRDWIGCYATERPLRLICAIGYPYHLHEEDIGRYLDDKNGLKTTTQSDNAKQSRITKLFWHRPAMRKQSGDFACWQNIWISALICLIIVFIIFMTRVNFAVPDNIVIPNIGFYALHSESQVFSDSCHTQAKTMIFFLDSRTTNHSTKYMLYIAVSKPRQCWYTETT